MLDESVPDGLANKHTPLTQHQRTPTSRYRLLLDMVCDALRLTTFVRQHRTKCVPNSYCRIVAKCKGRFALTIYIALFVSTVIVLVYSFHVNIVSFIDGGGRGGRGGPSGTLLVAATYG